MQLKQIKPRKALNPAYLKIKPNRTEIENFKTHLVTLLNRTEESQSESEEFHKNLVSDFLKDTYYKQNHFINTKGRNDLVIHNGHTPKSSVGVIIEAKKPGNKAEMIKLFAEADTPQQKIAKLNVKAFQELVLYYMRERITHKNVEVKYLIATNINEWFIFDAQIFNKLFADNKTLVQKFTDFEANRLAGNTTDFFYKEIAAPFIEALDAEIEFTYFNLQDYQKPLRNADKEDDKVLIALFKLLSPEHLLKLPFTNDSNTLDKKFYSELLHIIGLTETKEGSKKLIGRNKEGSRNSGSILEDTIIQLDSLDKLNRLDKPGQYGTTTEERLFNVGLELSITWINRILFLKLLEAQLITYQKNDRYAFLNGDKIKNYDDLNSLFFQVLARKYEERNEDVKKAFEQVPYLNSSLFEPTQIEQVTLFISNLKDDKTIPIYSQSVLKDAQGKKRTDNLTSLQYLFDFLNAYDFSSEGSEDIQEDSKTLINASVLGLIFEKINGYKDGSFFTPGFITMYMCRETIRKAVLQKFNEAVPTPLLRGAGGVSSSPRRTIIPYNPNLKQLARDLRNNSTKTEIILWTQLKGKFENKYDFHRQKPLDNFISDFFCHELKLVIEIDGEDHDWEETQQKDFKKETRLNELGLNVLRFTDAEILNHLDYTLQTIKQYIIGFEKGDLSSFKQEDTPLNPLSRGEFALCDVLEASTTQTYFKTLDDVYEQIGEDRLFTRQQANQIVNSLKVCDPAVGSGHFLVSALNEIIAVKQDLKILQDRDGRRLKEYAVVVTNDELSITDEEGKPFAYNPASKESQRIQETLFNEKQTIIENCLFGVDINTNSVKICRLRLWIELLKNAYYKQDDSTPLLRGVGGVLETLPNIDINIKCGNSLVSRFTIDADLKQALQKSKFTIDSYRIAVATYRNAESKEQKREMERLIEAIKSDFKTEIETPFRKKLSDARGKADLLSTKILNLKNFGEKADKKLLAEHKITVDKLTTLKTERDDIANNKIFENAFEWRFEFPEVLNDEGDFVGFDVVIGNPPYGVNFNKENSKSYEDLYSTFNWRGESYALFIERAISILKNEGLFGYIIPDTLLNLGFTESTRKFILKNTKIDEVVLLPTNVFADATVDTILLFFSKNNTTNDYNQTDVQVKVFGKKSSLTDLTSPDRMFNIDSSFWYNSNSFNLQSNTVELAIIQRIDSKFVFINEISEIFYGIKAYQVGKGKPAQTAEIRDAKPFTNSIKKNEKWLPFFDGKDIGYYSLLWKENNWLNYGPWLAEPRVPEKFEGDKILIRKITSKTLIANYIPYTSYCNTLLFVLKLVPDKALISYQTLLGILNSKFIGWYFRKKFQISDADTFPQIMIRDIQQFAVPNENTNLAISIEENVRQIILLKKADIKKDTTKLENEIDQLVYQLYELTEEEIKIIETVN